MQPRSSRSFAALLEGHPLLDEVILFDRARYGKMLRSGRALGEFLRFLRELRRRRFDLVVDLQGLFRSGFLAFATGAERRVGFVAARESAGLFYTRRVRCPPDARHAVDRNLCVVAALGLSTDRPEFPLGLRLEEIRAAKTLLTTAAGRPVKTFTAVIPGARWESKRWRPERIAALIDRMHEESLPSCVLLGSAADRPFADRVVAACHSPAIDLVGRTSLRELAAQNSQGAESASGKRQFVLNRRAISCPHPFDDAAEKWRTVYALSYKLMGFIICVSDMARNLWQRDFGGCKGKGLRFFISRLDY